MRILHHRSRNDGSLKEKLKVSYRVWTFHFVVSSRTAKECAEMRNTQACMACKIIASTYFLLLAPSFHRPDEKHLCVDNLFNVSRQKTRNNETNLSLVFALLELWIVSHKNEID